MFDLYDFKSVFVGKRILVIGGETFIGQTLIRYLAHWCEVHATVHEQRAYRRTSPFFRSLPIAQNVWLDFYKAPSGLCEGVYPLDINDYEQVMEIINLVQPDIVFHLAAMTQVLDAGRMPRQTFQTNVMGTVNVLDAISRLCPGALVAVASSDKAYGEASVEAAETTQFRPQHPYDSSKAAMVHVASSYAHHNNLRIGVSFSSNVYGPGDTNWHRLIPETIRSFLDDMPMVLRTDGTFTRQYMFVTDAVEAYLFMVMYMIINPNVKFLPLNFAPEKAYSVAMAISQIQGCLENKIQKPSHVKYKLQDSNEIKFQRIRSGTARDLGWKDRVDLHFGLDVTVDWFIAWHKHVLSKST